MSVMQAGDRLGPYQIVSPLGAGGMGEVYRAKDPRLKREVAIKVLSADVLGDTDRLKRFQREAQAISALNHPNILSVYDAGAENGTPYIVSELIEGEPLRKLIMKGPVPIRKLLDIAVQIADGLAAAHQAGIVHRDLKPENIMITRENRVKILDFGLAKPLIPKSGGENDETASAALTESGIILGTVRYMSPEQASGLPADFRSDQFSVGLLLYEMATGKQAFVRNTTVQTLAAIVGDEPTPIATLNPKIPVPLRWAIERTLSKDPHQRYGATIDLYHELRNLRDHLSEATSTDVLAPTGKKWPVRRLSLAALFFILPAAAFLVAALFYSSTGVDLSSYRLAPLTTDPGWEHRASWSPDGRTVAYAAKVDGISQIFTRSLDAVIPAQITKLPVDCGNPFWLPDGTRIFFISDSETASDLRSVSPAGGSADLVVGNVLDASFSPDGKTLVFLRQTGDSISLWVSSPPGAKPTRYPPSVFDTKDYWQGTLNFSPDGSKIALVLNPTLQTGALLQLWILGFPYGKPRRVLQHFPSDPVPFHDVSWMPDSKHIVFTGAYQGAASLWMIDIESGKMDRLTMGSADESPSVSPDGARIAFTISDQNFDLIEIPLDGSPVRNFLTTSRDERDPTWSPDGDQYAYVTNRSGRSEIWIKGKVEGWDRPLVTEKNFGEDRTADFGNPTFSPDGQRLSYFRRGDKEKNAIWTSAVVGGPPVFLTRGYSRPSWSPDGEWIAFVDGSEEGYWLAKIRAGGGAQKVKLGPKGPAAVAWASRSMAWSPTGEWISNPTVDGLSVVSPDSKTTRLLNKPNPIVGGWSKDGQTIYGIFQREDRSSFLAGIDIKTGKEKTILDLGFSYSSMRGFSLAADGKSFITSVERQEGDLWILEGFPKPRRFFDFLSLN